MAEVTIVLPVSRPDYLPRIFPQLELLDCNSKTTSLLVYVDGDQRLYEKARNWTVNSKFSERLCVFRAKGVPSVGSVKRRRKRIADIHNELKELINETRYVLLIEDDTLFPINGLKKLLGHHAIKRSAGIISGIELGRWGFTHIGAWNVDDVYEVNQMTTPPLEEGLTQVDATGLYFCLLEYRYYKKHYFEPFEEAIGPDVNLGLWLRREGLTNYIDNSIKCTHLTKTGMLKVSGSPIIRVQLERTPSERFGWKTRQL